MSVLTHKDEYINFVKKFRKLKPIDFIEKDEILSDEQCSRKETEENIERLYKVINDLNETNERLKSERSHIGGLLSELEDDLKNLKQYVNVNCLMEILNEIKNEHLILQRMFKKKKSNVAGKLVDNDQNVLDAVSVYEEMLNQLQNIIRLSRSSEMCSFLEPICTHWNNYLIAQIEPIFIRCLKAIKWPANTLLHEEASHLTEASDALKKFEKVFEAFLRLDVSRMIKTSVTAQQSSTIDSHLVNENTEQLVKEKDSSNINKRPVKVEVSMPVEQLILPFKKRFAYHFLQECKTNRLDKPEWYLTQIINWIKNHEDFLEQITDPIFYRITKHNSHSTGLQVIYELVGLARRKMELDLTKLVYDDKLFAHLFDEVLTFTNELKSFLGEGELEIYNELNLVNLFIVDPYFSKLISLESKKTTQYIENILSNETAWNLISNPHIDENLDSFKIPNCIDKFILLLQSITERFSSFHDSECKASFVRLQLDSIDEFRLRLAQLTNNPLQEDRVKWPFYSKYYAILNSLNYLIIVLEDWKYQPIFMEVSEYLLVDSVFDEILNLLNHLVNEMLHKIQASLSNQLRVKIHQYTKIKWFCLNEDDQEFVLASHELFFLLSSALDLLKKQVSENLFDKLIRTLIANLNHYFIHDFLLKCTFNDFGVSMLHTNLNTNFIPIFKNFFNLPEEKFLDILECCSLLKLDREKNEKLKQLYDQVTEAPEWSLDEYRTMLNDFNVKNLEPYLTIEILNRKLFI